MKGKVEFTAEIFKEGEVYVSLCPELNVSSFGDSVDEAKKSLVEAVTAFLEECKTMGTFEEVLEEAGFLRTESGCVPCEAVVKSRLIIPA
ncbi:MAG: type II toxin-antitoxin system HicB family antitoxin [Bacillota bacterium]